MIRNLKALMLASLALAALSVVAASAAQANTATSDFHSNYTESITLTTTTDSHEVVAPNTTAKTSHQVFDIRKEDLSGTRSITCNDVEIHDATIPDSADGTTTEITTTVTFVGECQFLGQVVTVNMGACDFNFTANGTVHIQTDPTPAPNQNKKCKHGDEPITFSAPGCHVEVGEQTLDGIKYHTIETGGFKMVTLEASNIGNIEYNATGNTCPYGTTKNGLFTTGNTIVTGEKTGTQTMVNVEWKTGV